MSTERMTYTEVDALAGVGLGDSTRRLGKPATWGSGGARSFWTQRQEQDVNGQLNAKVIGDGLGRVGNFEGNTQYRMFFENLGFIASEGKKGLYATP